MRVDRLNGGTAVRVDTPASGGGPPYEWIAQGVRPPCERTHLRPNDGRKLFPAREAAKGAVKHERRRAWKRVTKSWGASRRRTYDNELWVPR